jgi:hypothetical protein
LLILALAALIVAFPPNVAREREQVFVEQD